MPGRAFYWNLPAAPESEIVEKDLRAGSTLEQHRTVAEREVPVQSMQEECTMEPDYPAHTTDDP